MARALGRKKPPDFTHVEKYPYSAVKVTPTPVIFGIDWYEGFDTPEKGTDGRYRIKISGEVRGGHCICAEPIKTLDTWAFHVFYDQGEEGACVGFGNSRGLSLVTGRQYDAFWLYDDARRIDKTYPEGEGSYVRSGMQALKQWGAHYETGEHCVREAWSARSPGREIKAYHWCKTAHEVAQALGREGEIPLLNSWGTSYPETVWVDLADVETLLQHEGEAGVLVL